jgi:DNA-binding NarL/FixJ family response regulator
MSTRIVIADDHQIIREGLRSLLGTRDGMEVVAEAADGRQVVNLAREMRPDLVIMDIGMPNLNGIEATRQIIEEQIGPRVIVLSMHSDKRFVAEVFKAGASGYLLKDCAFEELDQAIKSVLEGQTYISSQIAGVVIESYVRRGERPADTGGFSVLTSREREVLQLLAEGKNTKQVANELHVSAKTVETHRRNLMNKLEIDSLAELTKYAIREGFTTLER